MDPTNKDPRKESTDVFPMVDDVSVISPVDKILLPPEEIRKDKLRKIGMILVAGVVVVTATVLVNKLTQTIRLNHALADVTDVGTPQSIEHALSLVTNRPALQARLLANAAFGGDEKAMQEAARLVSEHQTQASTDHTDESDWQVAHVYLALTRGQPEKAKEVSEKPGVFDVQAADFLRGRALALLGVTDFSAAEEIASKAFELRPASAPNAALLSQIQLEMGKFDDAAATLDQYKGSDSDLPSLELMRARIEFTRSPTQAETLAKKVLKDDTASAREVSWANLLLAWSDFAEGKPTEAKQHLALSAEHKSPPELQRSLLTAQLALMLEQTAVAQRALDALSPAQYRRSERNDLTRLWLNIEHARAEGERDFKSRQNAKNFSEIAKRNGTLGEVLRAKRGEERRSESIERLKKIAGDPHFGIAATQELSLILPAEEAPSILAAQSEQRKLHPSVNKLAVQAMLRNGDATRAMDFAQRGYAAHEDEPLAAITLASVLQTTGQAKQAVKMLDDIHEKQSNNADVAAALGHAAYLAKEHEKARDAYQAALRANPDHEDALLGMLEMMLDARDAVGSATFVEQLKTHDLKTETYDVLYARYLVWRAPGKETRASISGATRRHPDSAQLQELLAQSYLQIGSYGNAASAFQQARAKGAPDTLMRASAAFALGLSGMSKAAESTLKQIDSPTPLTAQERAMIDLAKATIGIGKEKPYGAKAFAQRAQKALPQSSYVALVAAEGAGQSKAAVAQWRRALELDPPLPVAAGRLALILGPTPEGCALGKQYFEIVENDRARKDVREVMKACQN